MPKPFPDGHFYSPLIDPDAVRSSRGRIWPAEPRCLGVDFNDALHEELLRGDFPRYLAEYDYPVERPANASPYAFYHGNPAFSWLDSKALFVFLRRLRPARMVEIGSGYSSLLTADVNRRFLGGALDFRCIEPYPLEFLSQGVPGIREVIPEKVEEVPLDVFEALGDGDVLFIDSSHVSKTGSDVNHIYFEIVPRLAAGVTIHVHDMFLPADYPEDWVLGEERSWNEQYLVRALLMYSRAFTVQFGCSYAAHAHGGLLREVLGGELYGGGSLWIRKTA